MSGFIPSRFNKDLFLFPTLLKDFESIQGDWKDQGLTIYEEKNEVVVEAAMPGLNLDEIDVNLHKGVLLIKGQQNEEKTDENKKFYKKSTRSFSYSVALPEQIDDNQEPQADYKDGILKIRFKKAKSAEAKKISVKIGK